MGKTYPKDWVSRRLHSLLGLWLVIYLIEHLLTNSQAALFIGRDGGGFIHAVNAIHNLPYLNVIELVLLGLPFFFHAYWGVKYIFTAKYNSWQSDGSRPSLTKFPANHAFTWQRMAAWVLVVGIILHVIQFRFLDYPASVVVGGTEREYVVRVSRDSGLYTIADRMGLTLYDQEKVDQLARDYEQQKNLPEQTPEERQDIELLGEWVAALESKPLKKGQILVASDQFGKVSLMVVRNTFKDPWMMLLYTIFVFAAVYHGFRGVWSFAIVWGITLTNRAQRLLSKAAVGLMVLLSFLGLAAIWLTYWVNLKT